MTLGLLSPMIAPSLGRIVVVVPIAGTVPVRTIFFGHVFLDRVERVTRKPVVRVLFIVAAI